MPQDRIEIEVLAKGVKDAQKDIEKLKKEIENTGKQTQKSGKSIISTLGKVAVGAFAAFQTIKKGMNFAIEFAKFEQSVQAMETQFGVSSDKIIKKLGEVSKGTISNADLITAANKAMALNVTRDIDEMAKLMEVARVRGQAMGLDTTQAFNDIVTGIGRGSPLILDNLGIITKGWDKEAKAAGGAMDAQFILSKVLADGAEILARTGDVALTSAERFQKLSAEADNMKLVIGKELLPAFEELFNMLGEDRTARIKAITKAVKGIASGLIVIRSVVVSVWKSLETLFDAIFFGFDAIAVWTMRLQGILSKETATKLIGKRWEEMKKNIAKNNKGIGDSWKDTITFIEKVWSETEKKINKKPLVPVASNADDVKETKEAANAKLAIQKQALQAGKELMSDFFSFSKTMRDADLEDTLKGLEEEREARLTAAGTATADLAELDAIDKEKNLERLAAERDEAIAIGDSELAAEKQREIERIALLDRQKIEEAKINKEFDEKIAAEKTKAAKADKAAKIIAALANTALAITSTLAFTVGGPTTKAIAAAIIGSMGAAQTAIIAATPIPKFRQGTKFSPEGTALVGEDGPELLRLPQGASITPNNQITNNTTDSRSTVINVQANNSIELVNDLQQTYGINAFEGG